MAASRRAPALVLALACLVAFAGTALAEPVEASWRMEKCEGAATLALAPLDKIAKSLPPGYSPQEAATFVALGPVHGMAPPPAGFGYVGVEVWKCARITVGSATATNAVYASTAAVINPPDGSGDATLYFYKYENFFSHKSLVQQSERLGAPASLVKDASVQKTLLGADASFTVESGARYAVSTVNLGPMDPGSFLEWHEGSRGTSLWAASFTIDPGYQGSGSVRMPAGSEAAQAAGSTSGEGLGIHTSSSFKGSIRLTRG